MLTGEKISGGLKNSSKAGISVLDRERQETILHLVKQNTYVSIHEILKLIDVSEATVRRDLDRLESGGYIRRVRGGAEASESLKAETLLSKELPFQYRKGIMLEKKRLIAKAAAALCSDGETIIIDGGSTTYQMVEFLCALQLKIITNSFAIAEYLIKNSKNSIYLPGGIIYPESQLILDPFNENTYRNFNASKVFMGVGGIGPKGATNKAINLIRIEQMMISHAERLIILADSSKFDTAGDLILCGFDRIDTIITDSGISPEARKLAESHGVELIIV